jgi:mono/diheme cytochrome c family protein
MNRLARTLVGIGAALAGGLVGTFAWAWQRTSAWETAPIAVDRTHRSHATHTTAPEVVARGEHLVSTVLRCAECHAEDLGGAIYQDRPGLVTLVAPNVTAAMARLSDDELAGLLRHGLRPDGTPALDMPADIYQHLTRDDMRAVLSYLRTVPPVDRELPPSHVGPGGRLLWGLGWMPLQPARGEIEHTRVPIAKTPEGGVELGRYLAKIGGCPQCHGRYLSGGRAPGTLPVGPVPPNLTLDPTGLAGWSSEEFASALRSRHQPDGRSFAGLTDAEVDALWQYLQTVPQREAGTR